MKVTLQVNGREMTFSEEELTSILEEHFEKKSQNFKLKTSEITKVPTEGEWFEVNPLTIDQNLFKEKREDSGQEETRQLILEAFEEIKKNSKYAKPFKTMMPEKKWESKNCRELKELASKIGDHMADWVEQALEWAQRIANGETWEDICNKADTANWYRTVVWKHGYTQLVGGSRERYSSTPASNVDCCFYFNFFFTVPLVVLYE